MSTEAAKLDPKDDPANAGDSSEFNATFDEIASSSSAPAEEAAADEPQDDPAPDDQQQDEPQPDAEPAPGKEGDAAASAPASQTDDIWKDAPEPLRLARERELRDWEHRVNSVKGRLSASDRELQRYRQQQSGTQGQPPKQEQPQADKPAADDLLGSEDFKAFETEYPEVAGPMKGLFEKMATEIATLKGSVGTVQQGHDTAVYATNQQVLTERHPDWLDIAKDDRFQGWLQAQPKAIQEAAARNWEHVVDPADAGVVFDRWKAEFGTPAPAPAPTPDPKTADTTAKRQRQLESARAAGTKTPAITAEEPDDFDTVFDTAARKIDRERQAQRQPIR